MNFWDYNSWEILIQLGVILIAILIGNTLRRKIKLISNSLLPTSVIAGIIIFILKFVPYISDFINGQFMEVLTYHCLGLGFIAMSLKSSVKSKDKKKRVVFDSGIITVNGYLIQGFFGALTTIVLSVCGMGIFYAAGYLLPMGYGQGTGQALNFGNIYKSFGFENGPSFGLAIAAIGFLVACIVGVIYLNYLRRKGKLKLQEERKEIANTLNSDIYEPDEAPLNEAVDKLTIQLAFVIGVYIITGLIIYGLSYLAIEYLGNFGVNTLRPLFWGFNFLIGSMLAILIKKIIVGLKKSKIMNHSYINNYMMNRISGLFFDIMIVSGIAAIDWQNLEGLLIPLIAVCTIGAIATFVYIKYICKLIYPDYEYEAFFSIFGMLTGTASTGMILLREIDPNFETPAADNLVLQQLPAMIFGVPVILLIPYAGQGFTNALIVLAIVAALFIVYNIILHRKLLFKRKNK